MTAQALLSPGRVGRVTGSRVGAILGVNRYQSRDDVMRAMVRQALGAEDEFTGNDATDWGDAHEEDARAAYEAEAGVLVLDAQGFVVHPEVSWLGVSPDGLVGRAGMVEIKCPYRSRYTSAAEKPEYVAQMQLQMHCAQRDWTDFVIWRQGQPLIVDRVPLDPGWLDRNIDTLTEFHDEYERIIADPALAAPYLTERVREDAAWYTAAQRWADLAARRDEIDGLLAAARDELIGLAPEGAKGAGVQVIRAQRQGSVDYAALVKSRMPDADLTEWRKPGSVVLSVRKWEPK